MIFNPQIARRSVYIDFEGEGKNRKSGNPLPHMVGTFRPNPIKGGGGIYKALFFRESWKAPVNGSQGKADIADFDVEVSNLIEEASETGSYIIYWSDYERRVIELNAPHLLKSFEEVAFNLLPPLRTIKNKRRIELDVAIDKTLNQYMKVFLPKRPFVQEFNPGPAEVCRRIDHYSTKILKWSKWPEDKKRYVLNLLKYNEEDCRATWLLGRKLANMH